LLTKEKKKEAKKKEKLLLLGLHFNMSQLDAFKKKINSFVCSWFFNHFEL